MYIKIIFEYYIIKTVLIVNLEFRFKLVDKEKIEQSVINIIQALGDDVNREGLKDTPKRVSKMYDELFSGINKDPGKVLLTDFEEAYDDIVIIIPLEDKVKVQETMETSGLGGLDIKLFYAKPFTKDLGT